MNKESVDRLSDIESGVDDNGKVRGDNVELNCNTAENEFKNTTYGDEVNEESNDGQFKDEGDEHEEFNVDILNSNTTEKRD